MEKRNPLIFLAIFLVAVMAIAAFACWYFDDSGTQNYVGNFTPNPVLSDNPNARCYGGYPWVEKMIGKDVNLPAIYANDTLSEMGYLSDCYLDFNSDLMLTNMTNSSVIYYIGHGCPNALCFDETNCVVAREIIAMNGSELDELNLAIYIAYGSASDSKYGNVAYETYQKGAKCVLGFTSRPLMENSKKWSDYFMDGLRANLTVRDSASLALWDETMYYGGNTGNMEFMKIYGSENIRIAKDENTSQQQSSLNGTDSTQTPTAHDAAISTTTIEDTVTATSTPSPGPVFTETGPTTDANGTPILSKSQAWDCAEKYLESYGMTNILPEEVKVFEPKLFTDKENNQTLIWTFEIDRKDSMGFERGGIIAIDAYNGDIVWYAEFI